MVSITLSVPEEIKHRMNEFNEVNWSGFIRKCIIEKTKELSWKDQILKKLAKEKEIDAFSIKLARSARKGRFEELKKKGLV